MSKPNKIIKVCTCCGAGNGTCQIVGLKIKQFFMKEGIDAIVTPLPVAEAKSAINSYDLVVCNRSLTQHFNKEVEMGHSVIGLVNVMSAAEIKEKLTAWMNEKFGA